MTSPYPAGSRFLSESSLLVGRLLDPPRAKLRQTVGQSIPNAAFTALTFTTEDYDTANGHSTETNTSRYTAQVDGLYQVSGKVGWVSNATGQRASIWLVNGAQVAGSQLAVTVSTAAERQFAALTIDVELDAGDYVELAAYQDSGGALSTSDAFPSVHSLMVVRWVGTG